MDFTFHFLRVFASDLFYAGPILIFLLFLIVLIGIRIGRLEGWPLSDALYHAFINATTVGYGDFRPRARRSKLLAVVLAFVGLIFTGMIVAIAIHAAENAFRGIYVMTGDTVTGRMVGVLFS
jgi:voltage-gated potassium channel